MCFVDAVCEVCGKTFERREAEFKRSQRLGRPSFCSRSCSGKNPDRKRSMWSSSEANLKHLANMRELGTYSREHSSFRELLKRVRSKCVKKQTTTNLTLVYLAELWKAQEGKCPYLGIQLLLPNTSGNGGFIDPCRCASLDRIDSGKGYEIGNVQFVSLPLNLAKCDYSEGTLLRLLTLVRKSTCERF